MNAVQLTTTRRSCNVYR